MEGGITVPIVEPATTPEEIDFLYPLLINIGKETAAISEVVATLDPLIAQKKPPTRIVDISGAEMKLPAKYLKNKKTSSTIFPFSIIIPAIIKSGRHVNGKLSTDL